MIEVIQAGVQSTVRDLGRRGLRHLGVAQCGALDAPALIMANRLLDNAADAAGIEVVAGPFRLRFLRDAWFALAGADFGAELDGEPVWSGWRYPARAGQQLTLSGGRHGMRAYLALAGGIAVPLALGARATDLQTGLGGWQGRALRGGDRLPLGRPRRCPVGWAAVAWAGRRSCAACRARIGMRSLRRHGRRFAASNGRCRRKAIAWATACWARSWRAPPAASPCRTRCCPAWCKCRLAASPSYCWPTRRPLAAIHASPA